MDRPNEIEISMGASPNDTVALQGFVFPERFSVRLIGIDPKGHEIIEITAPNGDTLRASGWCGKQPCYSTDWNRDLKPWLRKHGWEPGTRDWPLKP